MDSSVASEDSVIRNALQDFSVLNIDHFLRKGLIMDSVYVPLMIECRTNIWNALVDQKLEIREKHMRFEKSIQPLTQVKEAEQIYLMFMDIVVWIESLYKAKWGETKNELDGLKDGQAFNLLFNVLFNMSENKFKEMGDLEKKKGIDCIITHMKFSSLLFKFLHSKLFKLYKAGFDFEGSNKFFVNYIEDRDRIFRHPRKSFRWILNMSWFDKFPVEKIATVAILDNSLVSLIEHFHQYPNQEFIEKLASFLDRCAGHEQECYIKLKWRMMMNADERQCCNELRQKRIKHNTLTAFVFKLVKEFNLNKDLQIWSIFIRQLHSMFQIVRDYRANSHTEFQTHFAIYHQKINYLLGHSHLIQYAVLSYISKANMKEGLFFAHFANVPKTAWPERMLSPNAYTQQEIEESLEYVKDEIKKAEADAENIKFGFKIKEFDNHVVKMIDNMEKLGELEDFIDSSDEFGFDAEWNQSYSGEMGILCIIQISTEKETMLVDIESFRQLFVNESLLKDIFQMFWGKKNKTFYGFAFESDIKTIIHNFPFLKELIHKACENFVCLRLAFNEIHADATASDAVFGKDLPDKLNLQGITERLLQWDLSKAEQANVWSTRPLRYQQQRYAAMDSLSCLKLKKVMYEKLTPVISDLTKIFKPYVDQLEEKKPGEARMSQKESEILMAANKLTGGKKTKSIHISKADIVAMLNAVNENLLAKYKEEDLCQVYDKRYVADEMCSQISSVLRRCGVSVVTGNPDQNSEKLAVNEKLRILTTGKSAKQYHIESSRIIDLQSSNAPLDKQFIQFFEQERIYLDPNFMKSRCVRCNSNNLCYVPTCVMKYIHYSYGLNNAHNMTHCAYTMDDITEVEEQCKKICVMPRIGIVMSICFGEAASFLVTRFGRIDLRKLTVTRLKGFKNFEGARTVRLSLAVHLNYKDISHPEGTLHVICGDCGKENVEAVDFPTKG